MRFTLPLAITLALTYAYVSLSIADHTFNVVTGYINTLGR